MIDFTARSSEQFTLLCYNAEDKIKITEVIKHECKRIIEDVILKTDRIVFNEYIALEYNDILVSINVCGIKNGAFYIVTVVDLQLYY